MTDQSTGEQLKEEGIAKALEGNEAAELCIAIWVTRHMKGMAVTGEEIRLAVADKCPRPRSGKAWGGIINGMVRHGLLLDTGTSRKMRDPRSHARRTPVWIVR